MELAKTYAKTYVVIISDLIGVEAKHMLIHF
jgi:hypothetical protein